MKKKLFGLIMAMLPLSMFAQEYKNEVKINVLNAVLRPSIELGYELSFWIDFHIGQKMEEAIMLLALK